MTRADQARELARYLTSLLPGLSCDGARLANGQHLDGGELDRIESDVDLAVLLELQRLVCEEPDLVRLPADAPEPARRRVSERLTQLLAERDDHALEVLWALLAGGDGHPRSDRLRASADGAPAGPNRPDGWWRKLAGAARGAVTNGWVRRQVAGILMNALIAVALVLAWRFAWPPPADGPRRGVLALAVFAVWCLSFLPGWLYVRFLGQRAGALWDEYVLSLHRLGWDRPGHLPRPPVTSDYYAEWFRDGGVLLAHRQNIYRQKFDAYYGKSVSETRHRKGAPVRIETLFPVFLVTATFTACWTAVLWDPGFVGDPSSASDILKFAFLGAYSFTLQMLIRRFFQSDLRPSAYANAMLRIITVLILVAALHQLLATDNLRTEAVAAFVVGFFPLVGMQALQRAAAAALRAVVPSLSPPYPLNQVDGLSVWYEARLLEEGIEDMQSLATANFVDVILHTRVPVGRLVDWVDQAHLYLHFDRIERGWLERTLRRPTDSEGDTAKVSHGSVTPKSRAGTRTRTALRQLGIRKATDLLKAFPPEQMDPNVAAAPDSPWAAHLQALKDEGLDLCQLRTMVRVLNREPSLAPVWNWQRRGVQAAPDASGSSSHAARRRPAGGRESNRPRARVTHADQP